VSATPNRPPTGSDSSPPIPERPTPSRRQVLRAAAAVAAGGAGALLLDPLIARSANVAGNETLKVGLIGAGGRGTGAAREALAADKYAKLHAVADAFQDHIDVAMEALRKTEQAAQVDVPRDRQFAGFDAYKAVLESCDVVLLATPPHFRPMHLKAAVEAGKHVFAEKPVAVDAPGVRSVLATCELAKQKRLSVVSGLCLRYSFAYQQAFARVHDGAIGDIVTLQANDFRGPIWAKQRKPDWTDMQWHMRNWYYYTWLSGDFNVEQHVHNLDVCSWAMNGLYPVKALGMGGRQVRTAENFGNIYDHFSVIYEYDNEQKTRLFAQTRQMEKVKSDLTTRVVGTKGAATLASRRSEITGQNPWKYDGELNNVYETEHRELFTSIRDGKPINNGEYMSKSTLLAIMGRMSAYTGQEITWDMAMKSKEDLSPKAYTWDAEPPKSEVAMPGVTKFL
jgi:predicted dehydrogenase